jgi:hypothetical protein
MAHPLPLYTDFCPPPTTLTKVYLLICGLAETGDGSISAVCGNVVLVRVATGGARTWAVLASLPQTAKLNGLDPFTWLNDVLTRIVSGEVKNNVSGGWVPRFSYVGSGGMRTV